MSSDACPSSSEGSKGRASRRAPSASFLSFSLSCSRTNPLGVPHSMSAFCSAVRRLRVCLASRVLVAVAIIVAYVPIISAFVIVNFLLFSIVAVATAPIIIVVATVAMVITSIVAAVSFTIAARHVAG